MLNSFQDVLHVARQNSNHPGPIFDRDYMADFNLTLRCLGPALSNSLTGVGSASQIPGCVAHRDLAMMIAGDAIKQLDEARYRAWSDRELGLSMFLRWERVLWRFCLCYPLGFLVAKTSIKKSASAPSWSPVLTDLADYAPNDSYGIDFSERHIDGGAISCHIHRRLFSADVSATSPMVSLALADAYSFKPNSDNPLAVSLRRSVRKYIINNSGLQLPFWWAYAVNYLLAHDDNTAPVQTHFARHQVSRHEDALSQELPKSTQPSSAGNPATPSEDPETTQPSQAGALCDLSRRLYAEGHIRVNGPGADLHVTEGQIYAVHPAFFAKLATSMQKPGVTADQVYDKFRQSDLLSRDLPADEAVEFFAFCPPEGAKKGKLVGSTRMVQLADSAHHRLLSPDFELFDNPDVRRKDGVRKAGSERTALA